MDQTSRKTPTSSTGTTTFSKAEFLANGKPAVEYAAATGTAVIVDTDGNPVTVISIPTTDLPVLDG